MAQHLLTRHGALLTIVSIYVCLFFLGPQFCCGVCCAHPFTNTSLALWLCFEISKHEAPHCAVLGDCFGYLYALAFHINLKISFSVSVKKTSGDFDGDYVETVGCFE